MISENNGVVTVIDYALPPECRLCAAPAAVANRPSAYGDAYHYCVRCVNAALERYDMEHR